MGTQRWLASTPFILKGREYLPPPGWDRLKKLGERSRGNDLGMGRDYGPD